MRLFALSTALILGGCTLPMQQDPSGPSASVRVRNAGAGFTQAMTFGDAQTCAESHLLGYAMRPGASATYHLPADHVITLSMGAFGVPPPGPNEVAWCVATFLSARLQPGHGYELSFVADPVNKTCRARLVDAATGAPVHTVRRQGQGAQFSGSLMGKASCTPDPSIDSL